ncbi:MAG TPA: hypothetical protein VFM03_06275 [Candidatus Limnocylindria bacterium]|nr:hypothetical protein [Candidatus Limnocylindria bacterium]
MAGGVTTALLATSCLLAPSVDCGPLDRGTCEEEAAQVVSVVQRDNRGRTVRSIQFLNVDGHARVMLDNGDEIGWGERPVSSPDAAETQSPAATTAPTAGVELSLSALRDLWEAQGMACSEHEVTDAADIVPGHVLSCDGQALDAEVTLTATAGSDGGLRTIGLVVLGVTGTVSNDAQIAAIATHAAKAIPGVSEREIVEWSRRALADRSCYGKDCVFPDAPEKPRVALQNGDRGSFVLSIDYVSDVP